jgi:thiol-disulfide isomerase/thioredoxin
VFGLVAVALITIVVLTFDSEGVSEFGSPEINGNVLPLLPDSGPDSAVGLFAPEVIGADYSDNPVSITLDGHAKVIIFVAHWCPHCQREVPIVKEWLDSNPLPENVDLYAVSTSISSTRENYPPSSWLDREGWNAPVIVDDATSSIGNAYGLTAFPFWAFVSADGTILARVTGGIATSDLDAAVATLSAQATG